jgi:2-C-methyl-D-erythritol 4-phosphate cytidylyltransferase
MSPKRYALLVAGGSGTRMKSEIPKQFLLLKNIPILAHTINQFLKCNCEIILVLPSNHSETFKKEVLHFCNSQNMLLAQGGNTRFESVKNGLDLVSKQGLVAVHDAVRPLVSVEIIEQSFKYATQYGAAVAAVDLKDSIREHNKARERSNYKLVQTPQTFTSELIKKAYLQAYKPSFTDDASVLESLGHSIHLFEGDYKNIKITTPEDLLVAEALMR